MASSIHYSSDNVLIASSDDKKHVHLELSTSGYRPKFVTHFIESREELEAIIEALQKAKASLE